MRSSKPRKYPRYSTGERLSFIQWRDRSFDTTNGSVMDSNVVASARSPTIEGYVHLKEIEGDVDVDTKEEEAPDDHCEKEEKDIASIYLTRYVNKSCHKEKESTSRFYCRMIKSTEMGCAAGVVEETKEQA